MTENIYLPGQFTSLSPKSHSSKNLCPTMGNLRNIPVEMSPFLNLKFVWFGMSLVASILTNGY